MSHWVAEFLFCILHTKLNKDNNLKSREEITQQQYLNLKYHDNEFGTTGEKKSCLSHVQI